MIHIGSERAEPHTHTHTHSSRYWNGFTFAWWPVRCSVYENLSLCGNCCLVWNATIVCVCTVHRHSNKSWMYICVPTLAHTHTQSSSSIFLFGRIEAKQQHHRRGFIHKNPSVQLARASVVVRTSYRLDVGALFLAIYTIPALNI